MSAIVASSGEDYCYTLHRKRGIETNEDGSVRCFKMRDGKEIMADEYVSSVPLADEYL